MSLATFADVRNEIDGKNLNMESATATTNTLADISSLISQQSKSCNIADKLEVKEASDLSTLFNKPRRGRVAEHPCWELVQRVDEQNYMICRLCSKIIKCLNTRNAMQHFGSSHPQIAIELDRSWQMKLRLKANCNRISNENPVMHRNIWKKRGRAAEHPSWRFFRRIDRKSSNCKLCGAYVAYACSGNLMKHLKSRHLEEFAITEREWVEIRRRKQQLCELRLKVNTNVSGSEEQSPSNFMPFDHGDDEQDHGLVKAQTMEEIDVGDMELYEEADRKGNDGTTSNVLESNLNNLGEQATAGPCDAATMLDNTDISDVGETASRILQSIGFQPHDSCSFPELQQQESCHTQSSLGLRNDAFKRRVNFFINGLAEDLVSFPLDKSLLCMRQIRKYMDEKLLALEGSMQSSEVDTSVT